MFVAHNSRNIVTTDFETLTGIMSLLVLCALMSVFSNSVDGDGRNFRLISLLDTRLTRLENSNAENKLILNQKIEELDSKWEAKLEYEIIPSVLPTLVRNGLAEILSKPGGGIDINSSLKATKDGLKQLKTMFQISTKERERLQENNDMLKKEVMLLIQKVNGLNKAMTNMLLEKNCLCRGQHGGQYSTTPQSIITTTVSPKLKIRTKRRQLRSRYRRRKARRGKHH